MHAMNISWTQEKQKTEIPFEKMNREHFNILIASKTQQVFKP